MNKVLHLLAGLALFAGAVYAEPPTGYAFQSYSAALRSAATTRSGAVAMLSLI